MKTLVIGINYAPEMIGCARYTSDLVAYIAGPQSRIEVVTAPPHYPGWAVQHPFKAWRYAHEDTAGVSLIRCPLFVKVNGGGIWRLLAPMTFGVSVLPAVLWRAICFRPDVILCVVPTLFAAPAAVLASWLTGARLVLHVQDLEVDAAFAVGHLNSRLLRRIGLAFERRMLRAADLVVSISKRMCDSIAAKGVPVERISLIRNWVDNATIHPSGAGAGFRARHGIPADAFVAMYAGHIGPKQALDVLLQAARKSAHEPRLTFVIAGDGPLKASLMAQYSMLPNVLWLPLQPEDQLCAMLNAADVHMLSQARHIGDLVMPSKIGGMLASGKQIIVAADADTEVAEFLASAAILVPAGDPDAMADAVLGAFCGQHDDQRRGARLALATELDRHVLLEHFQSLIRRCAFNEISVQTTPVTPF